MEPKGAGSELQESRRTTTILLSTALALASVTFAPAPGAAAGSPPPQPVGYTRDIAPLLERWCVTCHGADEAQGDLRLDSFDGVMRGGDTGPVVIPGDAAGSLLVAKVERRHRPSMPPRRKLPAAEVARLRAWIAAGAPR